MNILEFQANAGSAAKFLKALANPHRLMILCELLKGEQSVGALEQATGLRQSPLSQHLARLRQEELVSTRRVSQTIYYSLADPGVARMMAVLEELYCS
jgi:DNA-binding transcriptional ArsR family regulator